ncbi:endonuclease/exonuclease/phosphatase family protein [Deinococcus aquaticus]|uniref:Endonuclease/exonuclease/phosphatase family protein n=1 Tax=Deinococcus aquaticus TaxID=328692 RepID=A0ABY7V1J6_9DEIO|nr:endonuclease/exonuclease/phosphatase family protein [Deinococcus aquaticus]WDA58995.1 endonuclease/exonuclease/phosphatase family protein [Deinococcus aquaticus]
MKFAWMTLLLVCLTWALGEWPAERTLPTLLLAYAPPLLWVLATLPALAWALWRHQGRRVALAALLLAASGAGLLHWRAHATGTQPTLRVVTFNVLGGARTTPDELAGHLRSLNPDVLLLQESRFVQPDFRAAFLNALPGYAVAEAGEVMTLTRLPLLGSRSEALPGNRRELLVTRLEWRGEPLTVVNAHLGTVQVSSVLSGDLARVRRTRDARAGQVELLRSVAATMPGRMLLGGDLNTPPRGQVYRELRAAFGPDTHDLAGRGPGWTFPALHLRIDHLMARDLTPTRIQVLPWALSDHRPLLAEYRPEQTD